MTRRTGKAQRSKRTKTKATTPTCLNPEKQRHTLRVARRIAAKQGSHVYPCGDHYHLTRKSRGAL